MIMMNNRMSVKFNTDHNKVVGIGLNGIEIIRPDKWLNREAEENDETTSRFDENVNYLETNPQICTVVHANCYLKYREGDKLFLNYMAWEWTETTDHGSIIDTDFIMFQIMDDGSLETVDDLYLGEAIYSEEEKTASGIILLAGKKDNLMVRITHVPFNHDSESRGFGLNDIIISTDKNNYEFDYHGKKHIKLMFNEIVAKTENLELCQ